MDKKLYRDDLHKSIGGVCAGLAEYFQIDVSLVRLAFLLTLILKGGGLLIYVILWAVLPKKPYNFSKSNPTVDYTVPPMSDPNQPIPPVFAQPKQRSSGSVIAGVILVVIGGCFLLDQFDFIPDFNLHHLWPVILIGFGVLVLFTGQKKQPWENGNRDKKETVKDFTTEDTNENNNTTTL